VRPPIALGIGLFAAFMVIAILLPTEPSDLERHWAEWMRDSRTPLLVHVALVFNWLGHGIGRALVIAAIVLPIIARRRWAAALAFGVTQAVTPLLNDGVKALVDRPRPHDGLVRATAASFPSGHAAFAAATLVALVLLLTKPCSHRRAAWMLATLGIVGMAWSRTYLQVHWLLDVVAGSLLGAGVALVVFASVQVVLPPRPARFSV
jgi:membrane-associated phospholipid phosphatase